VLDLGDRWRIEVEDTGPGIAPEHQRKIFQPYVQLAYGTAGIGLGLATVDRIVRAHGGAVGMISDGHGSTFWFELAKPYGTRIGVPETSAPVPSWPLSLLPQHHSD
jgi:signal transduction histidine kinase